MHFHGNGEDIAGQGWLFHAMRQAGIGVYAIEWATTPYRDDILGPLGGVFHGTVVDVRAGHQFVLAEAYWVPPEGQPLGPMALQITCHPDPGGCKLHVRQDGCERRAVAPLLRGGVCRLADLCL